MTVAAIFLALCAVGLAQSNQDASEIASRDTPANFSTHVNLVVVPVVVRDSKGKAIGNLTKDDFQLFDKGKLQTISRFSVEQTGDKPGGEVLSATGTGTPETSDASVPRRFIAYLFDDVHVSAADLPQVRNAFIKYISSSLKPTDRAALFTVSGIGTVDFTDDHQLLIAAANRLDTRPFVRRASGCGMTYYIAELVVDQSAIATGNITCPEVAGLPAADLQGLIQSAATREVTYGEKETWDAVLALKKTVSVLSTAPGRRSIVLVSPGFWLADKIQQDGSAVLESAIRANIVINALNTRGQITVRPSSLLYRSFEAEEDVMLTLAAGTGGTVVHNANDYQAGFERASALPEVVYLLGFSPQNLRFDGSFHELKVVLKTKASSFQARRGYYVPKRALDPAEQTLSELREALFSRDELLEFPVVMQTQFFKVKPDSAKLSILARVDLRALHFRKDNGRNLNTVTFVTGLFDRNGHLIGQGVVKTVDLHVKDDGFEARLAAGLSAKTSFDVPPGKYVVRLVVRDSEGQMMAARNGVIDIP